MRRSLDRAADNKQRQPTHAFATSFSSRWANRSKKCGSSLLIELRRRRTRILQVSASQHSRSLVAEPQQPCRTSFICVKLNVSDLQIEMPCQHHMPELFRLNKGLNKSKSLTQRPHLHMKSRAIIMINIVYRHRVMTEA